jgi:hypothetical protein
MVWDFQIPYHTMGQPKKESLKAGGELASLKTIYPEYPAFDIRSQY